MIALKLAFLELRQGWKHFASFVLCLMLGIAVMAAVGMIGAVIETALKGEAQSLVGGDVEYRFRGGGQSDAHLDFLKQYGTLSHVMTTRAMVQTSGGPTLVEIKAVDAAYPLLGNIELHQNITPDQALADDGLIVDPILLDRMGLSIGDNIKLGQQSYTIRASLKREPDRTLHLFNFGPRVMLSHAALGKSNLVRDFSLTEHRYRLLINELGRSKDIWAELKAKFPDITWRISMNADGGSGVSFFMDQLMTFLVLSGFCTLLIAGIGIASSVRVYLEKKAPSIAVLKTIGASCGVILASYVIVLGVLCLAAGAIGTIVAAILCMLALPVIASWMPILENYTGIDPTSIAIAIWYGALITYFFSMPALLAALQVRPALLFRARSTVLDVRLSWILALVMGVLGIMLVVTVFATTTQTDIVAGTLGVMAVGFVLFGICAVFVRKMAKGATAKTVWLKLALGNLHRPGSSTATVIYAIGISLMVLIALVLTERNFEKRITRIAEEEAPSLFMIDIQSYQKQQFEQILTAHAAPDQIMLMPMIRGRITHLNGRPARPEDVAEDVRWALRSDRGLSYGDVAPGNAKLSAGTWWEKGYSGEPLVSIDDRFLTGMGLKLGDSITVNVLGQDVTARVASARHIDYTTFQINFSLMFPASVLQDLPASYIATVYMDDPQKEAALIRDIALNQPGVTIIRTSEAVELIQQIMTYIALALRITVGISLLAGLGVLISALSAMIDQRLYDTAILKVLGARQGDIIKSCLAEWSLLALATVFIAAGAGILEAYLIVMRWRGSDFDFMPHVTGLTFLGCLIVIWVVGMIGNRRIFNFRPSSLLRNE